MDGADGVAIETNAHRVSLKWHELRRRAHDPPFSLANLRRGLALGASMEVDIRRLADDTWVCLHDEVLDEETDGKGPVSAANAATIQGLRIRGSDFAPPTVAEIAAELAASPSTAACVQFDLKETADSLSDRAVANFAEIAGPVAGRCVLSGMDWAAVHMLGSRVPDLRLGYDPFEPLSALRLDTADSVASFLDDIVASAPTAAAFYLYHRFVLAAVALGINPVPRLRTNGVLIDAWTVDPTTRDIEVILPALVATGVDQITTNDPVGLAALWWRLKSRR